MIKTNKEGVAISGSTREILLEFITITHGVRTILSDDFGEEGADRIIAGAGKVAFAHGDDDKMAHLCDDLLSEMMALTARGGK